MARDGCFEHCSQKFGLEFEFIDLRDLDFVREKVRPSTRMIWVESPSNPTLQIMDIAGLAEIAHANDAIVVVDNTFATPIFQRPLELGADIVTHSTTKYIGGHSDLIGGAVMLNNADWEEKIRYIQFAAGAVSGPIESFLLHRSIKSLAVRMAKHAENAQQVAEYLAEHPKIKATYYPGLPDHPQHQLARSQMSGFSGVVSCDIAGDLQAATRFTQNLKVFTLAESLGGVESLINHPEQMTHASVPEPLRRQLGIGESLLRLSVGIESADDLIEDLAQALDHL